ncbi:cupin domain-containing protein [Paenibacillus humicola]|uniref:cupin domain-containing protein n=1 Tax=Paenibacillus humicola TaxID=3110540 RepID=UPI00237BB34E|nr:cupin domain-containing protein [Paenibacillus humicola]
MSDTAQKNGWTAAARLYEYSKAADPVGSGTIKPVAMKEFSPGLYAGGPSRIVPLDLSAELGTGYPATAPSLLANFVRILAGESLKTNPNATSELYYVISGKGHTDIGRDQVSWKQGDFIVLPTGFASVHTAEEETALYYVVDTPLLQYLGVTADKPRFRPTLFSGDEVRAELKRIASAPGATSKNRLSVLLNNEEFEQTLTVTETLWAMYGLVPAGEVQMPHRHNSVALDFIVDCKPGVYTLVGEQIDRKTKQIIDPVRVDWEPGKAFVTPPGLWHAHHNESGEEAYVLPIQDAGLQTYLRTLDIQFLFRD